jgi:hypothetical protein
MNVARAAAISFIVLVLFAPQTPCALFADGEDEENREVFQYPTLLSVAYDAESPHAGSVVILFEGVEGEDVRYRVYRAAAPLTSSQSLASAELAAEVTSGELPFRDVPREEGVYYYAITAVIGNEEQRILVPYQNATVSAVDFSPLPRPVEAFEVRRVKGTTVSIPFSPLDTGIAYKLYTSGVPFEGVSDSPPAQSVSDRGYFEIVLKENTPYYFAITSQNRLGAENRELTPGRNASAGPFKIEPPVAPAPKAVKAPEKRPEPKKPPKIPSPTEEIDRILRTAFFKGEYAVALEGLRAVLARGSLSTIEKSVVHYYMGQCEFYLGAYGDAVRSFILSKEDPKRTEQADSWIERCLERVD